MKFEDMLLKPKYGLEEAEDYRDHINRVFSKYISEKVSGWYPERYRPDVSPRRRLSSLVALMKQYDCDMYRGSNGGGSAYEYIQIAVPQNQLTLAFLRKAMPLVDKVSFKRDGRSVPCAEWESFRYTTFIQFDIKFMAAPRMWRDRFYGAKWLSILDKYNLLSRK